METWVPKDSQSSEGLPANFESQFDDLLVSCRKRLTFYPEGVRCTVT